MNRNDIAAAWLAMLAPPPPLDVAGWAEREMVLPVGSAEPGRYRTDRTPYVKGVMEALSSPECHTAIVTGSSQSGKSTIADALIGAIVDMDPATILVAMPTDDSAQNFAARLDALVNATPTLKSKSAKRSARARQNNSGLKIIGASKIVIASAGSISSLSQTSARYLVADEVDRYPIGGGAKEGDVIGLMRSRSIAFSPSRRKFLAISSPTILGASRIEKMAATGTLEEWTWTCCGCGVDHVPSVQNLVWEQGLTAEASYTMGCCCGVVIGEVERQEMIRTARWEPTQTGQPGVRSFRFRGLSSSFMSLSYIAGRLEEAQGQPALMQVVQNTVLGLPFDPSKGEGLAAEIVRDMAEDYSGDECPAECPLIVASADIQNSWACVTVAAVGRGDELHVLQVHELQGSPHTPELWSQIEAVLEQKFPHPSGRMIPISAAAVDAGNGAHTALIAQWSAKHRARGKRWYSTIGRAGWSRPLFSFGQDHGRTNKRLWVIGVDSAKERVISGLAMQEAGPGKIHMRKAFPEYLFAWATAEEIRTDPSGKRMWVKKAGRAGSRNELLDCLGYVLAVRSSHPWNIEKMLEELWPRAQPAPKLTITDIARAAADLGALRNASYAG